uniref:Uncharacterized protein n=2 Tax=Lygus hesperus TaxID=30085 RepID=A0A146KK57_LYGHE
MDMEVVHPCEQHCPQSGSRRLCHLGVVYCTLRTQNVVSEHTDGGGSVSPLTNRCAVTVSTVSMCCSTMSCETVHTFSASTHSIHTYYQHGVECNSAATVQPQCEPPPRYVHSACQGTRILQPVQCGGTAPYSTVTTAPEYCPSTLRRKY